MFLFFVLPQLKSNLAEVEKEERAAVLDADLGPKANVEDPNDGGGGGDDEQHTLGGGAPGELQHSLMKLKQFRHFYIVVVVYIYFTRIVVYFVDSTVCCCRVCLCLMLSSAVQGMLLTVHSAWYHR